MSNNKFESLLELLINEENDKAEALFHEIVVEKSRDIYENLADEEVTAESKDEEVKETEASEEEKVEETTEESKDEAVEEAKVEDPCCNSIPSRPSPCFTVPGRTLLIEADCLSSFFCLLFLGRGWYPRSQPLFTRGFSAVFTVTSTARKGSAEGIAS